MDGSGKQNGSSNQQERSSIAFPYSDLDAAIELVRGVHNAGGTACDSDQLAAALKMEAKGGGFRIRVAGAQTFGLINYERGGRVVLTDLGRQMLDPQFEREARVSAFLNVELFNRVYEEFKGGPLPPQPGLESAIASMGVGAKVKDRARQVLLRSGKQAGFFEQAPDRLIKPVIKNDVQPPAPKKEHHGGDEHAETITGARHPLIKGLLLTLPAPGTEWPAKDRLNWLSMANSIFRMIYSSSDSDDVSLSLLKEGGSMQK